MPSEEVNQESIETKLEEFTTWKPTERQANALEIPNEIFEVLYGGALGGGKTQWLLVIPIVLKTNFSNRQLYEHPDFIGIIFRRTFPELEKGILPKALKFYEALGAKYNETKKLFVFPSGAKIFLSHMEKEKDVRDHKTNEYNYVGLDQAEEFTEYQIRYISSRIRCANPDLPKILRMAANPGGESHTFLRNRFVAPHREGNVILYDKLTNQKRIYIPAKLTDNPYLMKEDPGYINRLNMLPEQERDALMSGNWFSFAGQVFQEFRKNHFPGEPDNALHVIPRFPIPTYWPKILAIDWGWSAKTFAIWIAVSPEGRLYVYRTYSKVKTSVRTWSSDLARLSQDDGEIVRVALDPSAFKERGQLTIAQEFQDASGLWPEKADNDRHSGISLLHEYLRWKPKPPRYVPPEGFNLEIANRIFRNEGIERYNEYLDLFKPEPPEGNIPILQIFDDCEELIEAIQLCQYHELDKEDVKEWDGDDPFDTLRYGIKASKVYLEDSVKMQALYAKQGEITKQLEESGDMHRFYMRMAKLDHERREATIKPVRLHH